MFLAKIKTVYVCKNCGHETPKMAGKCFNCGEWNTYEEKVVTPTVGKVGGASIVTKSKPTKLKQVKQSSSDRIVTGNGEFDRVMGGGIVKDSITIISAPPGMGKSTLILQLCNILAEKGYKVLYASGEESDSQIKNRADRTVKEISENLWVVSDTSMDAVLQHIEDVDADVIIIDSIQTFTLAQYSGSRAGTPTQVVECATALKDKCKDNERPRASLIVCQMTKDDEMSGPRTLEHLVDTVLYLEGESGEELRTLFGKKNRFGEIETGLFAMQSEGMIEITNPSEYFMTKRAEAIPGCALAVVKDGTRPIVVEIESLVSTSYAPFPSRTAMCFTRKEQLNTLISILEQRGGINLFDKNVTIQTTGGIKLTETSVNLAVIMSIVSSVYDKGIPSDTVFIGELGLTGELKKVPALDQRLKELNRLGFKKVYIPVGCVKPEMKFNNLTLVECQTLGEVITKQFGFIERKRKKKTEDEE